METNQYAYKEKRRKRTASKIFWGLFFLVGGIAIILNQIGLFSFMDLSLGNVIWSVLLIAILIKSLVHRFWFGVFLSLYFLAWIYADVIGLPHGLSWWPILGAAVFLSIGFTILFRPKKDEWYFFGRYDFDDNERRNMDGERERMHRSKRIYAETVDENYDGNNNNENPDNEKTKESSYGGTSEDESEVVARANFGSAIKYVNSKNFKKAILNCSFGAIKMYFDNAQIQDGEAEIYIDASFCGIELYIPSEWQVNDEMDHLMGGIEEKNPQRNNGNGPTVKLIGYMKFSGIEIIYV